MAGVSSSPGLAPPFSSDGGCVCARECFHLIAWTLFRPGSSCLRSALLFLEGAWVERRGWGRLDGLFLNGKRIFCSRAGWPWSDGGGARRAVPRARKAREKQAWSWIMRATSGPPSPAVLEGVGSSSSSGTFPRVVLLGANELWGSGGERRAIGTQDVHATSGDVWTRGLEPPLGKSR
jgi:hypothetical protein